MSDEERRVDKEERGKRVRRGNWVKKCSRQRSCIYSQLNRVLWHKQRQKGHFCVSVALNDSLQYRLQWLQAYNILMSQCVNAKRLIVTDYQLSEVVKKDENRERIEDVKAWQALSPFIPLKIYFCISVLYLCAHFLYRPAKKSWYRVTYCYSDNRPISKCSHHHFLKNVFLLNLPQKTF